MNLEQIIILLSSVVLCKVNSEETINFYQESVRIFEDEVLSVEFNASKDFRASVRDPGLAEIVNASFQQDSNSSVFLRGKFLGHTMLQLDVPCLLFENDSEEPVFFPVSVLRSQRSSKLTLLFTLVMGLVIFCNTFIMGLQLDWKVVVSVIKRPIAPGIGFLCQFGLMPLIATGYAYLMLGGLPSLQFGYFAVGCSPGGGPSNMWTLLLDGNLDLSVTMTFFSNVGALAMMPFWLYTLGQVFYKKAAPGQKVGIPFENLAISLILLIGPIFLGMLTRHFKPTWAEKSRKIVKFSSLVILFVAIPFGIYANLYLFSLITWRTVLAGMALPWTGFLFGFVAAWIFRQNGAIAMLIMNVSLPKPDGDMAIVMPLCVLIFTPIPMFFLLIIKTIRDRIEKRRKVAEVGNDVEKSGSSKAAEKGEPEKAGKVDKNLNEMENGLPSSGATDDTKL